MSSKSAVDPFSTNLARVLILGRPNVGKSTLFNQLAKCRDAVVNDREGVTVDVKAWQMGEDECAIALVDSGGFDLSLKDPISIARNEKVLSLIPKCDLLLFVVDARTGLHPLDEELWKKCRQLKAQSTETILLANKADTENFALAEAQEFYKWGADLRLVSAEHQIGIEKLRDEILKTLGRKLDPRGPAVRFAFIGRPNVGKSTWCNRILGEERSVVTPIPGTTRDVLIYRFEHEGTEFEMFDTAGVRRSARRKEDPVEAIGTDKALRALEHVDVAVLVIDASEGITQRDATLAEEAWTRGAGLIVLANKWDQVEDALPQWREKNLRKLSYFGGIVDIITAVGLTGKGSEKLLSRVRDLAKRRYFKLETNRLNDKFPRWMREYPHPRGSSGKYVSLKYLIHTATAPQRFLVFSNHPKHVDEKYLRYLEYKVRDEFRLGANPIYFAVTEKR